ncbi:MAG: hypothetical protein LC800_16625 [Acidobacteria bacterium]|nr:hypothetical protein [Acidobacteriota bacterium]
MRLDHFLRASRLVVRRTVAQELCEAGAVEVNGAAARSSRAVRAGDEIKLRRRHRRLTVRVLGLPAARTKLQQTRPIRNQVATPRAACRNSARPLSPSRPPSVPALPCPSFARRAG